MKHTDNIDAAACQRLWCAMLLRNLTDATGHGKILCEGSGASNMAISQAQNWIGSNDFRLVCDMAGFNPDAIEEKYRSGELAALIRQIRQPMRNKKPRPEGRGKHRDKDNPMQRHHNVVQEYDQHHNIARA